MTPERLRQIEELYHAAREREPNERAAFLAQAGHSWRVKYGYFWRAPKPEGTFVEV
jgi:hypothetical protein